MPHAFYRYGALIPDVLTLCDSIIFSWLKGL
jgi:hypothetical protein